MMRRTLVLLGVGLALVLVLAACGQPLTLPRPLSTASGPELHMGEELDTGVDTVRAEGRRDPSARLEAHELATAGIVSDGPTGKRIKNLSQTGTGSRAVVDATTDVWVHGGYAYTGTYNSPCGGDPDAGIWVWDVSNRNDASFVTVIPSPAGSRTNDVKVAAMSSGDVLVHSNESCGGGPGGFEVYDVDDPASPVHLASVRIDELNPIANALFGGITDVGVHNLFLFSRDGRDYVAAVAEGAFHNFRVFDITDPSSPVPVGAWGAEEIFDPGVGDETADVGRVLDAALWLLDGFGASQNRFLHDITVSRDGTRAYLSNWDAGLVLLDISDPSSPSVVSVALDPTDGSRDGEVNSHAAWPSEDGSIVVESEEDFDAWEANVPPANLTLDSPFAGDPTIPATAISTIAGDHFETNQTGNVGTVDGSSVEVTSGPLAGNVYAAAELRTAAGSPTFGSTGPLSGELVWIGRACAGDAVSNSGDLDPGDIAVVRRGACFFEEKAATAAAAGASAVIIANNVTTSTPWGGLRIWDYSDPANPVLASVFDTTCSAAAAPGAGCDSAGTYSVHNVVVESRGNETFAYISWYWDGMLVLDVTDPYAPREVARYTEGGTDFWGVYKEANSPWIFGSDRNGGLAVFKELGRGTIGKK